MTDRSRARAGASGGLLRGEANLRALLCAGLFTGVFAGAACDAGPDVRAAVAVEDGPSEVLSAAKVADAEGEDRPQLSEGDESGAEAEPERSDRPPADPEAIGPWLRLGGYLDWEPRSAVHRTDEHGGARVLFNPLLTASHAAGAESHPPGAAAVRELYEADLVTPKGLALMVKIAGPTDEATAAEEDSGWFWYEVFSLEEGAVPTVAELDAPGCIGCHSAAVDLVIPPETPPEIPRQGEG